MGIVQHRNILYSLGKGKVKVTEGGELVLWGVIGLSGVAGGSGGEIIIL